MLPPCPRPSVTADAPRPRGGAPAGRCGVELRAGDRPRHHLHGRGGAPRRPRRGGRARQPRSPEIPSVVFLREDGEFLVGEAAERRGARRARPAGPRVQAPHRRPGPDPAGRHAVLAAGADGPAAARRCVDTGWPARGRPARRPWRSPTRPTGARTSRTCCARRSRLAGRGDVTLLTEPEAAADPLRVDHRVGARRRSSRSTTSAAAPSTPPCCARPRTGFELLGAARGHRAPRRHRLRRGRLRPRAGGARRRRRPASTSTDPAVLAGSPGCGGSASRPRRRCRSTPRRPSRWSCPDLQTEIRTHPAGVRGHDPARRWPTRSAACGGRCDSAGWRRRTLKAVVLVGGSCRIPLVAELVARRARRAGGRRRPPQAPVALGAALLAGLRPASADVPAPATPRRARGPRRAATGAPAAAAARPPWRRHRHAPVPATTSGAVTAPPPPRDAVAPDHRLAALVVPVEAAPPAPTPRAGACACPGRTPRGAAREPTPVPVVPADLPPEGPRNRRPC